MTPLLTGAILYGMNDKNENNGDTRFLFAQWRNGKQLTPELEEAARALKEEKRRLQLERRNRWYFRACERVSFWVGVNMPIILKSVGGALLTAFTVYLTKLIGQ